MELKDFVAVTLKQIVDGVIEAQDYARTRGAHVSPLALPMRDSTGKILQVKNREDAARDIEFDVAVTTCDGTQTKGGVGIVVGPVALGSQGQSKGEREQTSRIRFCIPVILPMDKLLD
jgi:hypothetical protein